MHRTFLASVIAATALVVAPIGPSASAAPVRCQGEMATIVGTPDTTYLRGTPGRDVIVTRGAFEVQARGGDDLICVTSAEPDDETGNVRAGAGDDAVHVTSSPEGYIWTELGPGADTFSGGDGWDTVWAGDALEYDYEGPEDAKDAQRDVISTGAGDDMVIVGQPGASLLDQVNTGAGTDELTVMATSDDATSMLDLGPDHDTMMLDWPDVVGGSWLFDNGAGSAAKDGVAQFRWARVEGFDLPELGPNPVSFRGSDLAEHVDAGSIARVELGGGNDGFSNGYNPYADETPDPGVVIGGAGRDVFVTEAFRPATVDLARGSATFADDYIDDLSLDGFENVRAYGGLDRIVIRGDAADNVIRVATCRATVAGAGGEDRLISEAIDCGRRSGTTMRGGPGDDLLRGGATSDRLLGGAGDDQLLGRGSRDVAKGGSGRDVCAAEVRRSCSSMPRG